MMQNETERLSCTGMPLAFDPVVPVLEALKKWWLAAAVALAAGMLAFAWADSTYVPRYTARCTLAVYAQEDGAPSSPLAKAFAEVVSSPVMAAMEQLHPERFGGTIRAAVLEKTNLVTLRVTAGAPENAVQAMEQLLADHARITGPVTGALILELIEPPAVPEEPDDPPQPMRAFWKAALGAGGAVLGLLVVLSWFRDTVRGPEEAMEKLEHPYLGAVCRRSGFRRDAALGKLCRRVECAMGSCGMLLVTEVRPGDGADTVAEGLVRAWQAQGKPDAYTVTHLPLEQALESLDRADAAVLVLRCNRSLAAEVNRAAAALGRGQAKLLGCVCVDGWSTGLFDGEAQAAAWYRRHGEVVR